MLAVLVVLYLLGFRATQHNTDAISRAVHTIEQNRYAAVKASCEDRNHLADGIQGFIVRVAPKLTPLARRQFHVERSCARYTRVLLSTGRPPPR